MEYKTNAGMTTFDSADMVKIEVFTDHILQVYQLATDAQLDEGGRVV